MAVDIMKGLTSAAGLAGGPAGLAVNAGLQAAMGVAQMVQAGKQNKEAKDLQKNFVDARYEIGAPILDNQALAESRASQGLSDAARSVYEDSVNRKMTLSVDAILRGGGSINSISDLYDTSEDDSAALTMLEEELRLKTAQTYMAQNERYAAELEKQWQVNEYAPAQDKKQMIATLRGQANDNKWKGLNTIGSAVGNYVGANQLQNNINTVYGNGNTSGDGRSSRPSVLTDEVDGTTGYQPLTPNSIRYINPTPRMDASNDYLRTIFGLSNIINRPR